jgi:TRAP-type C4-dicarboxylate transport system permease small subunit
MVPTSKGRPLFVRIATIVEKTIVVFSAVLAGAAILAMALLIPVDVLGRYLFGKPTLIAVEVCGYLLVCLIFLGLVYTAHAGRNITVELLTAKLPPRLRRRLHAVVTVFLILFSAWLAWFALGPVLMDFSLGTTSLTGPATPIWMPSSLIPLGFALLALKLAARALIELGSGERQDPAHE